MNEKIHKLLTHLRISPHQNIAADTYAHGISLLSKSVSDGGYPSHNSHVNVMRGALAPQKITLAIDCGGTNTRASLFEVSGDGREHFTPIFKRPHDHSVGSIPFDIYCRTIFKDVANSGITRIDGIAIVWSNDFTPTTLQGSVKGSSAVVTGKDSGVSYRKREPFLAELKDGDDIGHYFLKAAREMGFDPEAFVVVNDTIAVACARSGSVGGVVVSSGANATSVKDGFLTNLEAGAHTFLKKSYLSEVEEATYGDRFTIEQAMAGSWIVDIFHLNLGFLAQYTDAPKDLLPLSLTLKATVSTSRDLATASEHPNPWIASTAQAIINRSAILCGVMGAISAYTPMVSTGSAAMRVINLDSRLAEGFSGYLETAQGILSQLHGGAHPVYFNQLREDTDAQSIPIEGAARAIHQFY